MKYFVSQGNLQNESGDTDNAETKQSNDNDEDEYSGGLC